MRVKDEFKVLRNLLMKTIGGGGTTSFSSNQFMSLASFRKHFIVPPGWGANGRHRRHKVTRGHDIYGPICHASSAQRSRKRKPGSQLASPLLVRESLLP
jgi:hypothetical protein